VETVNGFGVEIVGSEVLYQCPNCNPVVPYNLGAFQKLLHIGDKDNDGLADVKGLNWNCPSCRASVSIPYEDSPSHQWGITLKEIFKQKRQMFERITIAFTGLDVLLGGSPDYLDDDFLLTSHATIDKKFKVCFVVNGLGDYDLYVTTQLQDDASDWGSLPEGWTELDCIMKGTIRANTPSIEQRDVTHILDQSKVTGLV
jgi:hypothetical protein